MKKFAQIIKNRVHYIFSQDGVQIDNGRLYIIITNNEGDLEESDLFHPEIKWIEITNVSPEPQEGWDYIDGIFSPRDSKKEAKEKLKKLDKESSHVKVLELLVDNNIIAESKLDEDDLGKVKERKALKAEL